MTALAYLASFAFVASFASAAAYAYIAFVDPVASDTELPCSVHGSALDWEPRLPQKLRTYIELLFQPYPPSPLPLHRVAAQHGATQRAAAQRVAA